MTTGTFQREFPRGQVLRGWDPQNPTTRTISLPVATDTLDKTAGLIWKGQIISVNAEGTEWVKGAATGHDLVVAVANADTLEDDVQASGELLGLQCSGQYRFGTPFFAHFVAKGASHAAAATAFATAVKGETTQEGLNGVMAKALAAYNADTNPYGGHEAASYVIGTPLTYCKDDEVDVIVVRTAEDKLVYMPRSLKGFVRPAIGDEPVIGKVAQTQYGPYKPTDGAAPCNRDMKGVAIVNGVPTQGGTGVAPVPTGVWPMRTTIGSAVDSSSMIYNSYLLVWDSVQH